MHVCVVELPFENLTDDLFERALASVDDASRARIRKFFRREDAWRCLIGRTLPFYVLGERSSNARLVHTSAGKPYIESPTGSSDTRFKFNVSHDSSLVVMTYDDGGSEDVEIGVDVMRCKLPQGETLRSFVRVLSEQLTASERRSVLSAPSEDIGVTHLFRLWTLKEAYTKTLGLGLGFDFSRVEYDIDTGRVRIDGQDPSGWRFIETKLETLGDLYNIVAARRAATNGTDTDSGAVLQRAPDVTWLTHIDAISLLEDHLTRQGT